MAVRVRSVLKNYTRAGFQDEMDVLEALVFLHPLSTGLGADVSFYMLMSPEWHI